MLHWPEKFKWIEGKSSKIKYAQGLTRAIGKAADNLFVKLSPCPRSGIYQGAPRDKKIIVSLTSYPGRIESTYYAIKSLMSQSMKPDRIILWLSALQFPDKKLPQSFEKLKKAGLEIRFTEDDLRSHKKYYYILQEQKPDELVITFDDDLIYEKKAIQRLYEKHFEYPDCVICNRGVSLLYSKETGIKRRPLGTGLFTDDGVGSPSSLVAPSTGAGCLYPFGIMPESTFNKDDIINKAFTTDDLWIWYNCLRKGVKVIKTKKISRALSEVYKSQNEKLFLINGIIGNENDRVLSRFDFSDTPYAPQK